jgi:hypothetical protein
LSLGISATTANDIDFTVVASDPWILPSQSKGRTPATITVRADPKTLPPGPRTGSITFFAPQAKNSPQTVAINLVVIEALPELEIQPTALSFDMNLDDPALTHSLPLEDRLPAPQTLTIHNAGGGHLEWTALPAGDWFTIDKTSGTDTGTVEVRVKPMEFPAGKYTGIILFTAPGATPAPILLTFNVNTSKPIETPKDGGGCSATGTATSQSQLWSLFICLAFGGLLRGWRRGGSAQEICSSSRQASKA